MIRKLTRFLLLAFTALTTSEAAALEWKQTAIDAEPEKGEEVVRLTFDYKNTSEKPVQILGVTTTCGCTDAMFPSSTLRAGEEGTLFVVFTIGKRTGLQEKHITIVTDDSSTPTRLTIRVKLPEAAAK